MVRIFLTIGVALLCSCTSQGPAGTSGDAGLGLESLTDPSVLPKVIWTNPANGEVGPLDGLYLISVRFNKIMDITTIPFSATLTPADSGYAHVYYSERTVYSERGDVVTFRLWSGTGLSFRVNQVYTVSLAATIADVNGATLSEPYSFSFVPEPYVRVVQWYVGDSDDGIPGIDNVAIFFNALLDSASIAGNVSVAPELPGSFSMLREQLTFTQSQPLQPSTTYVVTIGTGVADTYGNKVPEPVQFSFTAGQ